MKRNLPVPVHDAHRYGYISFVAGMPLKACPPFRDEDMAMSWRMGWRHAKEERGRLRDRRLKRNRCTR
jgi:ribosome modulation factor